VPAGWPEITAYEMWRRDLAPEYACALCHARLFDADTETRYLAGKKLPRMLQVDACPACGAAVGMQFQKRTFACDNYYTISPSSLGLHASCAEPRPHVWLPVAI